MGSSKFVYASSWEEEAGSTDHRLRRDSRLRLHMKIDRRARQGIMMTAHRAAETLSARGTLSRALRGVAAVVGLEEEIVAAAAMESGCSASKSKAALIQE